MKAMTPEAISKLFVERANAGDADGLAELYEEDSVLAYPPGRTTVGRAAIRAASEIDPPADRLAPGTGSGGPADAGGTVITP